MLHKVVVHVHVNWNRDWLIDNRVLLALVLLTLAPKCLFLITFVTQSRILVGVGGSREIKITHLRILFRAKVLESRMISATLRLLHLRNCVLIVRERTLGVDLTLSKL